MEQSHTSASPSPPKRRAHLALAIAIVLVLAGLVIHAGAQYWNTGRFVESTDDAYVKADFSVVAPRVSGYVASVDVEDNQPVKAGQLLATLDDRDYQTALAAAIATREAAAASLSKLDALLKEQMAHVDEASAQVLATSAQFKIASINRNRSLQLKGIGYGSEQNAQDDQAKQDVAAAELSRQRAALHANQLKIGTLKADRAIALAKLQLGDASVQQAQLNIEHTQIVAPIDGTVGSRTLRLGQWVQPGSALMAVVPLRSVYVVANFKETQLGRIREGNVARIHVDSFGDENFTGQVQSLSPASGLEFSLLPSDNATGNFTKIVQRVPVKIVLEVPLALQGRLRPGMSVQADVTTDHQG